MTNKITPHITNDHLISSKAHTDSKDAKEMTIVTPSTEAVDIIIVPERDAVDIIIIPERDAEAHYSMEQKSPIEIAFDRGYWTCVQNLVSIMNGNEAKRVCSYLIRTLGISENEAQTLSSIDEFRREEIYDAMDWDYYWLDDYEASDISIINIGDFVKFNYINQYAGEYIINYLSNGIHRVDNINIDADGKIYYICVYIPNIGAEWFSNDEHTSFTKINKCNND